MEEALTLSETLALWGSAIGWTLVGILFVKVWQYDKKVKFDPMFWIKDNTLDILRGIFLTLIVLKLGDITVEVLKYMGVDFTSVNNVFNEVGADPVQLSLVIAILAQYYLYKRKESKKQKQLEQ